MSWGVSPEQYKNLNSYDLACLIKANQTKERRNLEWLRWAVACIITPHYKKGIEPNKLFKFPDEKMKMDEELKELNSPEQLEKTRAFVEKIWEKEFGKTIKL